MREGDALSTGKSLRVLVVAPGSLYSTFDTYVYYLDAFQHLLGSNNAYGFAYHNVIEYHSMAREAYLNKYQILLGDQDHDIARASRELVLEIVLRRPDVVLFIDGSQIPLAIYRHIHNVKVELNRKFITACYLTESPYTDDSIDGFSGFFDVLFTNEKNDVKRRDPNEEKHIYYVPHSYSKDVHYPLVMPQKFQTDVFFCGSIYPERAALIKQIDWNKYNASIRGAWAVARDAYAELKELYPNVFSDEGLQNGVVADYYRAAKIVLNFNRVYGWDKQNNDRPIEASAAYSIGPRVIEAVACGAFVLSEPRPELSVIFGDSLPTFNSAQELEDLIRYYLDHPEERIAKAKECFECIQGMDYETRAEYMIQILSQVVNSINGGTDG